MHELTTAGSLAAELSASSDALRALGRRVEGDAGAVPQIETGGWDGPASWACQLSLALLAHELAAATELLGCAANMMAAAAWEVQGDV
jgi:hypothetical protein